MQKNRDMAEKSQEMEKGWFTFLTMAYGFEVTNRDWTDDFREENGKYHNECVSCQKPFTGHKRRHVCKLCDRS